jgi:serine phosphatase RsbU (regulator of sigma subunit)
VVEPTDYHQFAVTLGKGDLILIYTDALLEASSPSGAQLGEKGLLELVGKIDAGRPETFARSLVDAVGRYRGEPGFDDDVTLLLLHHNAADPPRPSLGEAVQVIGKMMGLVKV